jgi:hypothetical protein
MLGVMKAQINGIEACRAKLKSVKLSDINPNFVIILG